MIEFDSTNTNASWKTDEARMSSKAIIYLVNSQNSASNYLKTTYVSSYVGTINSANPNLSQLLKIKSS